MKMEQQSLSASAEWSANWPLIVASTLGVSLGSVVIYALGQFMSLLETEFGWTRVETSAGVVFPAFLIFLTSGLMGWATDRFDCRLIAIPGIVLSSLSIAAFSLANQDVRLWLAFWWLYALGASATAPTLWVAVVSRSFAASRSLAMSIVLCGAGLSSAAVPPMTRYLIDAFGWRASFQILALIWGGTCLVMTVLFFFDRQRAHAVPDSAGGNGQDLQSRSSVRSLICSPAFLKLAVANFGAAAIIWGLLINVAPLLADRGFQLTSAANIAGLAGLGVIAGKIFSGWLFDHVRSSIVTNGSMLALAIACVSLLGANWHFGIAMIGCVSLGVSSGSLMAVTACLTARHFKSEDFGTVYGALTSVMALAGIVGPTLAAVVHDITRSYDILLWAGMGAAVVAAVSLASLKSVQFRPV